MQPTDTPFITGWFSIELPEYRPCGGTYCYYAFDTIPPIDMKQFNGTFDWLSSLDENTGVLAAPTPDKPILKKLATLQTEAKKLNITLPEPFLAFMQNTQWQYDIPTCTACYFDLSEAPVPDPVQENHYYIRFLNDQQDVLMWYLYLKPDGDSCVVVSPVPMEKIEEKNIPAAAVKGDTIYCGETFESFLYRFWIENSIWFADDDGESLTSEQKAYLAHYQKP